MSSCLILHPQNDHWPKNSKNVFIGIWCLENVKNSFKELHKYNIINLNEDLAECDRRFLTLVKIYKLVFPQIAKNLDRINNVNLGEDSWEIIIGPWLRQVLGIVIERYRSIEIAYEIGNFDSVQVSQDINLSSNNSTDLISENNRQIAEIWNYNMYSRIVNFINNNRKKLIMKNLNLSKKKKLFKFNIKNFFKKKFITILNQFNKKSKLIFFKVNLKFFDQIKLFFYLKQIPKIFEAEEYESKEIDNKLRKNLFFKKDNAKNFYNFFLTVLPEIIPTDFIENFQNLKNKVQKYKHLNNSKAVITAFGYFSDELFKFWLSLNRKNFLYLVLQHGNNYFTGKYSLIQTELKLADKFISWGDVTSYKKNIIPFYNLNNLNLSCGDIEKNNKIIIYARPLNPIRYRPFDFYSETLDSFRDINLLFQKIEKKIKINTYLKLYPHNEIQFKKKIFEEIFTEKINILSDDIKKKDFLKESKLVIHFGDTTGLLETISLGIPTVAYIKNFKQIRKKAIYDYELLKKTKIVFEDVNDLVSHVNEKFENIAAWWLEKETLIARNNFVTKYSKSLEPNKNLIKLTAKLLNTIILNKKNNQK